MSTRNGQVTSSVENINNKMALRRHTIPHTISICFTFYIDSLPQFPWQSWVSLSHDSSKVITVYKYWTFRRVWCINSLTNVRVIRCYILMLDVGYLVWPTYNTNTSSYMILSGQTRIKQICSTMTRQQIGCFLQSELSSILLPNGPIAQMVTCSR